MKPLIEIINTDNEKNIILFMTPKKKRGQPAKPIKLIVSSFRVAPKKKDLFRKRVNLFLKEYQ